MALNNLTDVNYLLAGPHAKLNEAFVNEQSVLDRLRPDLKDQLLTNYITTDYQGKKNVGDVRQQADHELHEDFDNYFEPAMSPDGSTKINELSYDESKKLIDNLNEGCYGNTWDEIVSTAEEIRSRAENAVDYQLNERGDHAVQRAGQSDAKAALSEMLGSFDEPSMALESIGLQLDDQSLTTGIYAMMQQNHEDLDRERCAYLASMGETFEADVDADKKLVGLTDDEREAYATAEDQLDDTINHLEDQRMLEFKQLHNQNRIDRPRSTEETMALMHDDAVQAWQDFEHGIDKGMYNQPQDKYAADTELPGYLMGIALNESLEKHVSHRNLDQKRELLGDYVKQQLTDALNATEESDITTASNLSERGLQTISNQIADDHVRALMDQVTSPSLNEQPYEREPIPFSEAMNDVIDPQSLQAQEVLSRAEEEQELYQQDLDLDNRIKDNIVGFNIGYQDQELQHVREEIAADDPWYDLGVQAQRHGLDQAECNDLILDAHQPNYDATMTVLSQSEDGKALVDAAQYHHDVDLQPTSAMFDEPVADTGVYHDFHQVDLNAKVPTEQHDIPVVEHEKTNEVAKPKKTTKKRKSKSQDGPDL